MSIRTGRIAALAATLGAFGAMFVATTSASALVLTEEMKNWGVTGSITPKKLNQTIVLPGGAFNGALTEELPPGGGTLNGAFDVPTFTQGVLLLGADRPLQLSLKEGSLEGTYNPALEYTVAAKAKLGIAMEGLEGKGNDSCQTVEPVTFKLGGVNTFQEFDATGLHFTGTSDIPAIECEGRKAKEVAEDLTKAFSGPNNAVSLALNRPA
jgi:hypothetical protein